MVDLCVDLCGTDAGMSEQFLQGSYFSSSREHVGREAVTECMRADIAADSDAGGVTFYQFPDRNSGQWSSTASQQES